MLNTRNSMLLLNWDLRGLSACVAGRKAREWQLSEPVASARTDFRAALTELIERLAASGVARLPHRASLFSDQVVSAALELPVDPARPRPPSEMAEIVRWELDPLIMQRMAGQKLGDILVARGLFGADDVRSVLEVQAERRAAEGDTSGRHRFGQLALELGLVDRDQLEESLTLQQRYREFGEDCRCGFRGGESLEGGKFRWLACGVDASRAESWRDALKEQGLVLDRILPLSDEAAFQDLKALGSELLRQHAAGLEPASIGMRPPAPPRLRRPTFLAAAALILSLASLGLGEAALATLNGGAGGRLAQARVELDELKQSLRRFDGIQRRTLDVELSLEWKRSELAALRERNEFLAGTIAARQQFVENFMSSLGECASEDLVIDRVRETRDGQIVIGGWALHDTAVQWFAREVLRQNPSAGLSVKDKKVRLEEGRLGLMGYAYDLTLEFSDPAGRKEAIR